MCCLISRFKKNYFRYNLYIPSAARIGIFYYTYHFLGRSITPYMCNTSIQKWLLMMTIPIVLKLIDLPNMHGVPLHCFDSCGHHKIKKVTPFMDTLKCQLITSSFFDLSFPICYTTNFCCLFFSFKLPKVLDKNTSLELISKMLKFILKFFS